MIAATTYTDVVKEEGLVANHAYSIISTFNVNGIKLVKLRNTWGYLEWNGEYGDKNIEKWTPELKKGLNDYEPSDNDGIFFMTPNEFKLKF